MKPGVWCWYYDKETKKRENVNLARMTLEEIKAIVEEKSEFGDNDDEDNGDY